MRLRERGMGNLPFIAVLVLFVIAVALFFMAQDKQDSAMAELKRVREQLTAQDQDLYNAGQAYDALQRMWGLQEAALLRNGNTYPKPEDIENKLRDYLMQVAGDMTTRGEAKVQAKQFQVNRDENTVKVIEGDVTRIQLYGVAYARETIDAKKLLDPLPNQLEYAAKAIEQAVRVYENEFTSFQQRVTALNNQISENKNRYDSDVATKQASIDTLTTEKNDLQDQVNNLSATNDTLQAQKANVETEAERTVRVKDREIQALGDRLINEKERKAIALAEDPKDGEVAVADSRRGIVYINRGRLHKISRDTKFTVWRAGKGDVREDVAVIRVIEVDKSKAKARIVQLFNPRVPVTAGMNISNPFYDPYKPLTVYVYGDLSAYPTEVAKRRLAESGALIANELTDKVDVVVLGEPPVMLGDDEMMEDEEGSALAERRRSIERKRRLEEIMDKALAVGAIVVTEDVLRTFIQY